MLRIEFFSENVSKVEKMLGSRHQISKLLTRTFSSITKSQPNTLKTLVSTNGGWESLSKCSRAVRINDTIYVSGTCAQGETPTEQVNNIFSTIESVLKEVDSSLDDVVSTRIFASNVQRDWEEIGAAHGKIFNDIKPACTLVGGELLMDWMLVEIECTAVIPGEKD